ncbi:MAG: hypothetical protein HYT87_02155 [Nitrospirae bacterium]|nr:hypothetical protein [Nitrospirota bacterium]
MKNPFHRLRPLRREPPLSIRKTLKGMGVKWIRTIDPYDVEKSVDVFEEAFESRRKELKVIISDAACALEAGRELKKLRGDTVRGGGRWVERRLGVDEDVCTGDHSCISLNGCPSLTVRNNPNPLRADKIAWIDQTCVGCGLCGEVAHVARLCPSFFQVDRVENPGWVEHKRSWFRRHLIRALAGNGATEGAGTAASQYRNEFSLPPSVSFRFPLGIYVPSIGGLGSGVLLEWLSMAALGEGLFPNVMALPGLSQRAGRTLSYMEISDRPDARFNPFPEKGRVHLIVAHEFLELLRALEEGYGGPETYLLSSNFRYYTTFEKLSLESDAYTLERFEGFIQENSHGALLLDAYAGALGGRLTNAHLLGALAAAGYLPLSRSSCEEAIRRVGVEVDRNLRDFHVGGGMIPSGSDVRRATGAPNRTSLPEPPDARWTAAMAEVESLAGAGVRPILLEAARQLAEYQSLNYVRLYLGRVREVLGEAREKGSPMAEEVATEFCRVLATRMCYEDVIRVAELKTDRRRLDRIEEYFGLPDGSVYDIKDFFKPEIDEFYGLLPRWLGGWVHRMIGHKGWSIQTGLHTSRLLGFMLLKAMTWLKPLRPYSFRFEMETGLTDDFIRHVKRCTAISPEAARLAIDGGGMVRGYGHVRKEMVARWKEFAALTDAAQMRSYWEWFVSGRRFGGPRR